MNNINCPNLEINIIRITHFNMVNVADFEEGYLVDYMLTINNDIMISDDYLFCKELC